MKVWGGMATSSQLWLLAWKALEPGLSNLGRSSKLVHLCSERPKHRHQTRKALVLEISPPA